MHHLYPWTYYGNGTKTDQNNITVETNSTLRDLETENIIIQQNVKNNTNENEENNTLFVDSLKGSLTILLFTNQELQIANHFDTNGDEDALYYLLLTLEQSKVKVETLQVILSSTASFKTKLDKYFNKITITSSNKCALNITEGDKVICSII